MRTRTKLLVLLATLTLITSTASAAVKAGTTCSKLGATSTSAGKKYTCIKSGKKLVWNKGVTVAAANPAAKPTPTPTVNVEPKAPTPTVTAEPKPPTPTVTAEPKAPTSFNDLLENYEGIASVVWNEAQRLELSGKVKTTFTIEIGPNTKLQEGLEDPKIYLERAVRLWSGFDQSTTAKVFIYSFSDLAWVQQKNRDLGGSWFTPEDLSGNCTSLTNCNAFGSSYRGVAQIFVGVPVKSYNTFMLGNVRTGYGHEYTHTVQHAQFASQPTLNGYSTLPCWFSEGQPQVSGHTLGHRTLSDYKRARESWFSQPAGALGDYSPESIQKFYTLAGAPSEGKCDSSIRSRIYDIGYMTVEALASIKGIESTMQVIVEISKGLTFNASFEKVYGISWNDAAPILARVVSREFIRP